MNINQILHLASFAFVAVTLTLLAECNNLSECVATHWFLYNQYETPCPMEMYEVYRKDAKGVRGQRYCCKAGSKTEKLWKRYAERCIFTQCQSPNSTGENLQTELEYTHVIHGIKYKYEETFRVKCTLPNRKAGVMGYWCRQNSTHALLATLYGAEQNEFPHMAHFRTGNDSFCGATIYNKHYVITAAHCVVDEITRQPKNITSAWKISVGRNFEEVEMPENDYEIESYIVHEGYSQLMGNWDGNKSNDTFNDVALVKIKGKAGLAFGQNVKALPLAPIGFLPKNFKRHAIMIGWGQTVTYDFSIHLHKTNMIIVSDRRCLSFIEKDEHLANQYLCLRPALNQKWFRTKQFGDSGGPAICRGPKGEAVLCGVASFVSEGHHEKGRYYKYVVFVEVSHFRDWIELHAGPQDAIPNLLFDTPIYGEVVKKTILHQVHITISEAKACGGTLVSNNVIVTAAQCVTNSNGNLLNHTDIQVKHIRRLDDVDNDEIYGVLAVKLLEHFEKVGQPLVFVNNSKTKASENYYKGDLAVIRLIKSINISFDQLPLIASWEEVPLNDSVVELSFSRDGEEELSQRHFKLISKNDCQMRLDRLLRIGPVIKLDNDVICGLEKYSGGSLCDRELGGGVICKGENGHDILCGVQTFRSCYWNIPSWFINVGKFQYWIKDQLINKYT